MTDIQGVLERLDSTLKRKIQALNNPGLAFGITDRERLLFVGEYGLANRDAQKPVNPETLFQIGSISKSFTSIALLQLQDQGLLDIDEPVSLYLPWFEVQSDYPPITLRHLMSHTAGIIRGGDDSTSAFSEVWNLRYTRATAPPGEMFHYSNTGYKMLGLVLENVLQQSISEILQERLLGPLGMLNSTPTITQTIRSRLAVGYEPYFDDRPFSPAGALVPATWLDYEYADGSICSTAADMCAYLRLLLNQGAALLSPESFNTLIRPVIQTDDGLHGEQYSLGLVIEERDGHHIISHGGGMVGFTAHVLADLDAGLGITALTNTLHYPGKLVDQVWEWLVSALDGEDLAEINFPNPYLVEGVEEYPGRYHCGEKEFELTVQDEHLFLTFENDTVRLGPLEWYGFLVPHPAFELYPLKFEHENDPSRTNGRTINQAYHGGDWYLRSGYTPGEIPDYPAEWEAFTGHYRAHNPWQTNFRVVLRKGSLVWVHPFGEEEPLTPIEPALFRLGSDPRSPEYIRFELIHDGKAMYANYSGGVYSRMSTP